jgi:hypothetical protein
MSLEADYLNRFQGAGAYAVTTGTAGKWVCRGYGIGGILLEQMAGACFRRGTRTSVTFIRLALTEIYQCHLSCDQHFCIPCYLILILLYVKPTASPRHSSASRKPGTAGTPRRAYPEDSSEESLRILTAALRALDIAVAVRYRPE